MDVVDQDVGCVRQDDDFHPPRVDAHETWHAERQAFVGGVAGLATERLIGHISLEDGLIFRRQRRLLSTTARLVGIELEADEREAGRHGDLAPLALQVGIFRVVECLSGDRRQQCRR